MTENHNEKGQFSNGNKASRSHGQRSYIGATKHYLAKRDPAQVDPEFRAIEAEVLAFVEQYGPAGAISLQATRATVAAELLWRFMLDSPSNFKKYANQWRQLSSASVRHWRELQVDKSPEDLAEARQQALAALENQS